MKKIGGYLLSALGYLLVFFGVIGLIKTIIFIITADASAYSLGFVVGRSTVLFLAIYLGYLAFKKSRSLNNPISEPK